MPLSLPFQIKICGLTHPQHAIDAMEAGADAIGLNFFEPSIRFVSAEKASLIAAAARSEVSGPTTHSPKVVGVFVNHTLEQILALATSLQLDGIQLHGDETVDFFTAVKKAVVQQFDSDSCPFFVRALRTQPNSDQTDIDRETETKNITEQIQSWSKFGIDTILLDAAATGEFGGTGKSIDWSLMPQLQASASRPLALAGGLNPTNVAHAIRTAQVASVDVASGVEAPKGIKCREQVRQFVQNARMALDAKTGNASG